MSQKTMKLKGHSITVQQLELLAHLARESLTLHMHTTPRPGQFDKVSFTDSNGVGLNHSICWPMVGGGMYFKRIAGPGTYGANGSVPSATTVYELTHNSRELLRLVKDMLV